ncbi:cobalt-precorrin-7 (C(5))-methyltransferase [Methanoplanus endosymbiosus]
MLTEEAIYSIKKATLIYGSKRAIEICRRYIPEKAEVVEITDYKALRKLPEDAVVLSTGDPMFAGLGYLKGEVVPGISSMSYAFARLKIPLSKVAVSNAHGKEHMSAIKQASADIENGHISFIIADPDFDIGRFAEYLADKNILCNISVCENLGYPDERITSGNVQSPPKNRSGLFVVIAGDYTAGP